MSNKLNHFDQNGQAHMVDVSDKAMTSRTAIARGEISMSTQAFELIKQGNHKKGDVLGIARIAAIMAAKNTSNTIPLCHPLPLSHISINFDLNQKSDTVICKATVKTTYNTGVEMEALNATNVALLTIYDMCKAVDKSMIINQVYLEEKQGGKSGHFSASKTS